MKLKLDHDIELLFIQNTDGAVLITNSDGVLIATLSTSKVEFDNGTFSDKEFYLNFAIKDKSRCVAHDWAACIFKK